MRRVDQTVRLNKKHLSRNVPLIEVTRTEWDLAEFPSEWMDVGNLGPKEIVPFALDASPQGVAEVLDILSDTATKHFLISQDKRGTDEGLVASRRVGLLNRLASTVVETAGFDVRQFEEQGVLVPVTAEITSKVA